jgi:arsenate reductase-like glutaredoxin family protein
MISSKGTGRLYIVEGTMRQDQYMKVLETRMIPQAFEWFPGNQYTFMHDSAPCHKAKKVTEFLRNKKIQVLDWPGNSPDLNPIENLWELLKREISKELVTNKRQLIERLVDVWHRNENIKENCIKCIESMPQRIEAVIAAKGGVTKY